MNHHHIHRERVSHFSVGLHCLEQWIGFMDLTTNAKLVIKTELPKLPQGNRH